MRISTELSGRIRPPSQHARSAPSAGEEAQVNGECAVAGSRGGPGRPPIAAGSWRPTLGGSRPPAARPPRGLWPGRREPSRSALVVGAEAGDHVAQRGELRGDRVATLGQPVDLGPERRQLALGVGLTGGGERVGLRLRGATICSASRRDRGDQLLGLAARPAARCWAACGGLAGALLGGVGALLGLGRRGAWSRRWRSSWCSAASRVSRSFSTARVAPGLLHLAVGGGAGLLGLAGRGGAQRRWSPARRRAGCCSASRLAEARRSSASAMAGARSCSMSAMIRARLSSSSLSWTTRMSSASRLGLGTDRRRRPLGLPGRGSSPACAVASSTDVGGLLLGQAQHLAGLAAESGVRRVLVLVDLLRAATRPRRSSWTSAGSGPRRLAVEAGLLGGERCAAGVDGGRCRSRRGARSAAAAPGAGARAPAAAGRGLADAGCCWREPRGAARLLGRRCAGAAAWPAAGLGDLLGGLLPAGLLAGPTGESPGWARPPESSGVVVEDGQALVAHADASSVPCGPACGGSVSLVGRSASPIADPCDAPSTLSDKSIGCTRARPGSAEVRRWLKSGGRLVRRRGSG